MKETLLCEQCCSVNEVEIKPEYYMTEEWSVIAEYKCRYCETLNEVKWANAHIFHSSVKKR